MKIIQQARSWQISDMILSPILAGYSLSPEGWAKACIETIRELKNASGTPLENVIPFWWRMQEINGESMLVELAPAIDVIDSLSLMNYPTTKLMINRFAQLLLDREVRNQPPVNIALEAETIVDETQWRYKLSEKGKLWELSLGQYKILILNQIRLKILNGNRINTNLSKNFRRYCHLQA